MIKEKIIDEMKYFYCDETDEWFPQYKDENNLTYELQLPHFIYLPLVELNEVEEPDYQLSMYGRHRLEYLEEHKHGTYQMLLVNGLWEHLVEVDKTCCEMEDRFMEQMSKTEGITEELKRSYMFEWVGRRNNLKNRVREIIHQEYIYV